MSNAYIPDQLHHMSRKELLEFAQTAHEENVKLVQQLAKANERVNELEKRNDNQYKTIQDMEGCILREKIEGVFTFAKFLDSNSFSSTIAAKECGFSDLAETLAKQLRKGGE